MIEVDRHGSHQQRPIEAGVVTPSRPAA